MKKIAIYCGASTGNKLIYQEKTEELGLWMVKNNYGLIFGGGAAGLMGIISNTIISNNGSTIGVMPTFLVERELAHQQLDKLIIVKDMHERKKKMIDLADIFIALPGGPGTLEEISEVVSWGRIGEHQNPCIFYNIDGYYDILATFFDQMVETNFLSSEDRQKILFSASLNEIEDFINHYTAPPIRSYKKNKAN